MLTTAEQIQEQKRPLLLRLKNPPQPTEEPLPSVELIVFAAASMTDAMNGIATMYADVAPNVTFKFNFDSSGILKTQIQEGADCDIFISASQKAMNQLDINADSAVNTEGLDFRSFRQPY